MVIFQLLPVESDWTVSTCNLITKLFSGANVLFLYCSLGHVFGLLMMAGFSPKHFVCNLRGLNSAKTLCKLFQAIV